jgi:uncharacterized protein YprB with RNaseH-like and TPR domain
MPGTAVETLSGPLWLWQRPVDQIISSGHELLSRYSTVFERGNWRGDIAAFHPDLKAVLETEPEKVLYLDIETTGLVTGSAFLVGLASHESESLVVRQLFARDYSEEPAVLAHLAGVFGQYDALVTFNGKSFDFRYLQERFVANAMPCMPRLAHLDLLHEGRRRWKGLLPNFRLQTLERHVCGRVRHGDIPSAEIPEAYHDFVRTGDARQIRDIAHHNALDLITMVEVVVCMLLGVNSEKWKVTSDK